MKKVIRRIKEFHKENRFRHTCWKNDKWIEKKYHLPLLSKDELLEVKRVWPCFKRINNNDLIYLRKYKQENGFDPYFLCDYQYTDLLRKVNPIQGAWVFRNKAMYDVWFPQLHTPKVYLKCINGVYYSCDCTVSREETAKLLARCEEFVIKPSIDTGSGKGVKLVKMGDVVDKFSFTSNLIDVYGNDFVVEEVVKQHHEMKALNPTSLNTCRITSMFIDGKFHHSAIFKIGKKGASIDNWNSAYLVGIDNEGKLRQYGYDSQLNKVTKTDNGIDLLGYRVYGFEKMVSFVEKYHKYYFPMIGIIGWDICIDEMDGIRVIEVNVDFPGAVGEQYVSGTFFKDMRDIICNQYK